MEAGPCHVYLSTVPLSWPMRFTPASFFFFCSLPKLPDPKRARAGSRARMFWRPRFTMRSTGLAFSREVCVPRWMRPRQGKGEGLKFVMTHLGQITTRVALCASIPNDPSHPREPIHAHCPILSVLCRQCVPTCREIIKFSIFVVTVPVIDMRGRCRLRFRISIIFGKLLQYAKDLLQYFLLSLKNSIGIGNLKNHQLRFYPHSFSYTSYAILTWNKNAPSSFLIAFNKHLTLLHSSNFYDVANSPNVVLVSKYISKNFVN